MNKELMEKFLEEFEEVVNSERKVVIDRLADRSDSNNTIVVERFVWHEDKHSLYVKGFDNHEFTIGIDEIKYIDIDDRWEFTAAREETSIYFMGKRK